MVKNADRKPRPVAGEKNWMETENETGRGYEEQSPIPGLNRIMTAVILA